jgi:hypothetical protein
LAGGLGIFQKQGDSGEDHPRRAETTLKGIMLDECFLERMKFIALGQPFDGDDLFPIDIFNGQLAGSHGLVVNQHRAGPAKTLAASVFGSGELEVSPQYPQKHTFAVNGQRFGFSVELETNGLAHGFPHDI